MNFLLKTPTSTFLDIFSGVLAQQRRKNFIYWEENYHNIAVKNIASKNFIFYVYQKLYINF